MRHPSYYDKSKSFLHELKLEQQEIKPILGGCKITDHNEPSETIKKQIRNSDVFVAILKNRAFSSNAIINQIEIAHMAKKPMLSLRQENFIAPNPPPNESVENLLKAENIAIKDTSGEIIQDRLDQLIQTIKSKTKPSNQINWAKWAVIFAVIVGLLTVFATIAVPFIERILDNPSTVVAIVPIATTEVAAAATNTPSPTPEPPTQTPLEIALDRATNFTGTNDDWKALYPTGFVQEFNGVEMVLVPKGCFMMGGDSFDDEQPVHEQCFDAPFWIDKTEVTNAQFRSVGCENTSSEPNQPRNCVNWFEARHFCASRDARLPTEAEWEYAARGVSNWEYPWGDEFVAENAVFGDNSGGKTANVGSRPGGASWAGALDMSGNVWEWVSSLYVDYEYNLDKSESDIDNTSARALRGGSFGVDSFILRAAFRLWLYPVGPSFNWGFRCSSSLK